MNREATKTYPLPDQEKLVARLMQRNGPAIDPYQSIGRCAVLGAEIEWRVVNTDITLEVLEKPVYVSYGEIWADLTSYFAGVI